ncbi:retroviral-like aspartic protease family protein [Patescibacteria group bacterium]|nr:retroviral-like aspartic protease family protein [Patescibacteria group bacterium]
MPKKKPSLICAYDKKNFDPPAPVLEVSLSIPALSFPRQIIESPALLDSGADITVIPQWIAQQLQLKYVDEIEIIGYNGVKEQTYVYSVKIIFDNLGDLVIRTIASNSGYVLIGRDILNKWSLFLKGRSKIFEIS